MKEKNESLICDIHGKIKKMLCEACGKSLCEDCLYEHNNLFPEKAKIVFNFNHQAPIKEAIKNTMQKSKELCIRFDDEKKKFQKYFLNDIDTLALEALQSEIEFAAKEVTKYRKSQTISKQSTIHYFNYLNNQEKDVCKLPEIYSSFLEGVEKWDVDQIKKFNSLNMQNLQEIEKHEKNLSEIRQYRSEHLEKLKQERLLIFLQANSICSIFCTTDDKSFPQLLELKRIGSKFMASYKNFTEDNIILRMIKTQNSFTKNTFSFLKEHCNFSSQKNWHVDCTTSLSHDLKKCRKCGEQNCIFHFEDQIKAIREELAKKELNMKSEIEKFTQQISDQDQIIQSYKEAQQAEKIKTTSQEEIISDLNKKNQLLLEEIKKQNLANNEKIEKIQKQNSSLRVEIDNLNSQNCVQAQNIIQIEKQLDDLKKESFINLEYAKKEINILSVHCLNIEAKLKQENENLLKEKKDLVEKVLDLERKVSESKPESLANNTNLESSVFTEQKENQIETTKIRINIKSLEGIIYRIGLMPFSTIMKVKKLVQEQSGIPVDRQKIVFNSKQLEDAKSLYDYNIRNENTLVLFKKY